MTCTLAAALLLPVCLLSSPSPSSDVDAKLSQLKSQLRAKQANERIAALKEVAALSSEASDKSRAKIEKLLVKGMSDKDLEVRIATLDLAAIHCAPETMVQQLVQGLADAFKVVGKYMMMPDPASEAGQEYKKGMDYAEKVVSLMIGYPDDRCAKAVVNVVQRHMYSLKGTLQPAVARTLASYSTQSTVDALLAQLNFMSRFSSGNSKESKAASFMHSVLVDVAKDHKIESTPKEPSVSEWTKWYKKNKKHFPKKLGKVKARNA